MSGQYTYEPSQDALIGKRFGVLRILARAEDYVGKADIRKQYLVLCESCNREDRYVLRNLTRRPNRKGCRICTEQENNYKDSKFGRNINGFIDRKIVL